MADVEIILSDSSDDNTIIFTPKRNFSPQKNDSNSDIEDIVNKYICENSGSLDLESKFKNSSNIQDKSVSESPPSQDDSFNAADTLKALSEKYKITSENNSYEDIILNIDNDKPLSSKEKKKLEKEQQRQLKNDERERKKLEKEREKSVKQALATAHRNVKPGECMRFIRAQIDISIVNEEYGKDIISALQAAEVEYNVESLIFPFTISWIRKTQSHVMDDGGKLMLSSEDQPTDEILLIMNCKQFVEHVSNSTLASHIQSLQTVMIYKKITLSVFGLNGYIRFQNNQKHKEFKSQVSNEPTKPTKDSKIYRDFPQVSRKNIEYALTELQILCNCSHRLVNSGSEMGAIVAQFTKSIAELPYKLQKQEKYQQTEWYASADGKDCVKVDKDGNGLQRLWKQMLTAFPLASLETAEAISSKYPTVTALMEAYENCENESVAELLLQDIPIRRAAGPISSTRRIGPELSKKVYNFFNAVDGDTYL